MCEKWKSNRAVANAGANGSAPTMSRRAGAANASAAGPASVSRAAANAGANGSAPTMSRRAGAASVNRAVGKLRRPVVCAMLILTLLMTMIPFCTVSAAENTKLIAFTFDDGPSKYTSTLLDGLKERGAVATFFMCGTNGSHGIVNHEELLDRMVEEGHQLSNHTWDHPSIGSLSGSRVASEFASVESLLFKHMGGSYIDMVRTPGGAYNTTIQNNTAAPIIIWSVDTLDWKIRDASSVYSKIMSGAKDGSIVLMHDIYQTSVQGALRAVDSLKAQGYEFVTVSELLRRRGITPSNGVRYFSALNNGTTLPAYTAPTISSTFDDAAEKTMVIMSTQDAGITLYYTTDGSYPKLSSNKYTGPFAIDEDATFKVVGYDKYGTRTPAATLTVKKYQVALPKASSENGMITLSCDTADAVLYYTTDGSEPTRNATKYTGPFSAEGIGNTLKIIGTKASTYPSEVAVYAVTDNGAVFSDVDTSRWYFDFVNTAVVKGIMNGMGDQSFAPQGKLTRAMMVQILYNMEGRPALDADPAADDPENAADPAVLTDDITDDANDNAPAGSGIEPDSGDSTDPEAGTDPDDPAGPSEPEKTIPDFQDVNDSDWFADAVRWAAAKGIVTGYSDTEFGPRDDILREQLVTMLYRYADKYKNIKIEGTADLLAYTDGWSVRPYAQDAFRWAIANGIINGYSSGALDPHATATRAEAAAILVRYDGKAWEQK